jgi:hypothetical protein
MMFIISVFSQLERETIAERIRDNMHELAKTGRWLGGNTPTGFQSGTVSKVTIDGKERKSYKLMPLPEEIEIPKRIAQLTEELEELRSEKTRLLARFDYTEDADMKQAKDWAKLKEKSIDDLRAKENHCEQELNAALAEFQTLSRKADAHNPDTLWQERLKLRKTMSQETEDTLRYHFGRSVSPRRLQSAESDVRLYLEEDEQSMQQYQRRMWQKEQRERRIIQRKELNR